MIPNGRQMILLDELGRQAALDFQSRLELQNHLSASAKARPLGCLLLQVKNPSK